jgi:predicted RNA-binding Zn ribbon-like protein
MGWGATERFKAVPAPAGLGFVQDFLNTRPRRRIGRTDDLLATVDTAQAWADEAVAAWAAQTGAAAPTVRIRAADLLGLVELREQVVALIRGVVTGDRLDGAALRTRVDATGRVELEPDGDDPVAGIVAVEIFRAQQTDVWRRLKTCRNEACPVAFYDRSPNNAGAWHDVRTCGNVANLRASRERRRAAAAR